jgi:hypothetical protein
MSTIAREAEQPLPVSVHSGKAELRQSICRAAVSVLSSEYGDALDSMVLTGSMARDEATCVWNGELWTILGDAEFLFSFKENRQHSPIGDLHQISQKIESALQDQRIECSVDLGPVPSNYFSKLPPHVFSFELKACGKQVFGHTDVLSQIPNFSTAEISREDAWRLLCNRLLELFEHSEDLLVPDTRQSERLRYKLVKLYLDMATTFLIFNGQYAPTYAERCANLLSLIQSGVHANVSGVDLPDFAKQVSLCTLAKLNPERVGPNAPSVSVREAIRVAHALWRWELRKLTRSPVSSSDSDLMRDFSSQRPTSRRLRGWAFAVRAVGVVHSLRDAPRWLWLAAKGSPRDLIYLVGTALLFKLEDDAGSVDGLHDSDQASLAGLLPKRDFPELKSRALGWAGLAQLVFENYQQFVLKTRT